MGVVKAKFNQSLWLIPSLGFWTQEQLLTAHSSPTLPINSGHSLFPQACSLQVSPPTPLFFWQVVPLLFQVLFFPLALCTLLLLSSGVSCSSQAVILWLYHKIQKTRLCSGSFLMEKPSRDKICIPISPVHTQHWKDILNLKINTTRIGEFICKSVWQLCPLPVTHYLLIWYWHLFLRRWTSLEIYCNKRKTVVVLEILEHHWKPAVRYKSHNWNAKGNQKYPFSLTLMFVSWLWAWCATPY